MMKGHNIMNIMQFGDACSAQLTSTSKVSKPKVDATDFVRFAKTAKIMNASDKRAKKVTLNGEVFSYDEVFVPSCMKEMIYPAVLTPNGDLENEADFLEHTFDGIIDFFEWRCDGKPTLTSYLDGLYNECVDIKVMKKNENGDDVEEIETVTLDAVDNAGNKRVTRVELCGSLKPFDGYELDQFCKRLYGTWKLEAEEVKVSDIRVAAPMNAEVIKTTCYGDEIAAAAEDHFPMTVKMSLVSEDVTLEEVDRIIKKWIRKALTR